MEELYRDILKFDQVKVFKDLPKKDIIEKLDILKKAAILFDKGSEENDKRILAISIAWIGFKLQATWFTPHKLIL